QLADHLVLPADHLADVELHAAHGDAHGVCVLALLVGLGRVDDRLRRDAADVETHAAHLLALDDEDLLAGLAETNGARIAARSRADHDRVVFHSVHGVLSLW